MKRWLAVPLGLALLAANGGVPAAQSRPVHASLSLAWDGYVRAGRTTQITIRLSSPVGGPIALDLRGSSVDTRLSADLRAGVPRDLAIPVHPTADRPLSVSRPGRGVTPLASKWYETALTAPLTVAVVARQSITIPPLNSVDLIRPSPGALPTLAAAYDTVDLLVADDDTLARLDKRQTSAIDGYLRECGRLVGVALSPVAANAVRAEAGCQGAYLALIDTPQQAAAAVARLLSAQPPAMPSSQELETLLPDRGRLPVMPVVLLLGFYLGLLAVAAAAGARPAAVALIPLLAAGAAAAAWWRTPPHVYQARWLEAEPGAAHARYRALIVVDGGGPNSVSVRLPAGGEPESTDGRSITLERDMPAYGGGNQVSARVATRLWSTGALAVSGTVALAGPLHIRRIKTGIEVVNTAARPTPAGLLRWRGMTFRLPVLAPGERWRPGQAARNTDEPAAVLLRKYARHAALLIPYPRQGRLTSPDAPRTDDWLFIPEAASS